MLPKHCPDERWELLRWPDIEVTTYFVSTCGRIVHPRNGTVRLLVPYLNSEGYERVKIYSKHGTLLGRNGGRYFQPFVHSLVAKTFVSKRPEGFEIDHRNETKRDNHFSNLRYLKAEINNYIRRRKNQYD